MLNNTRKFGLQHRRLLCLENKVKIRFFNSTIFADVKNNPAKFPEGYLLEISKAEKIELVKIFDRFNRQVTDTETSIEINFALMKFKHTVKRK